MSVRSYFDVKFPNGVVLNNSAELVLIAGPCQMESREHALYTARALQEITTKVGLNYIYKTSFDKANRTSLHSKRGIGLKEAISIFTEIKADVKCPILTDIHEPHQAALLSEVVDVIQIPALLCRQTDLLIAAAKTKKILSIKKGQFLAPWDMRPIIEKVETTGNTNILLIERGTCFGYNTLINDMRSIPIMAKYGYPIVFDATHSVQQPGGLKNSSGGQRAFVLTLARAAISIGIAGLFLETHENPDKAPCDGPCMVKLEDLEQMLYQLKELDELTKKQLRNNIIQ